MSSLGGLSIGRVLLVPRMATILCLLLPLLFLAFRRPDPLRLPGGALPRMLALAAVAALVSALVQHKGWSYHILPIELFTCGLGGVLAARWLDRHRAGVLATGPYNVAAMLGGLFALYAVSNGEAPWRELAYSGDQVAGLTALLEPAAGERVLVLSPGVYPIYPALNYAGVQSTARMTDMWLLQGAYAACLPNGRRYREVWEMGRSEFFIYRTVAEDFARAPPAAVLVDIDPGIPWCGSQFDFVAYSQRHPLFARVSVALPAGRRMGPVSPLHAEGLTRCACGEHCLVDAAPVTVARVAARRVLTDNATDTVRGIALAVLAYLIWTLGDATAKWTLPTAGVAGAMLWRGVFGMTTVLAVTVGRRGEGWRQLVPVRWGLVLWRSALSSFVSVTWYLSWQTMSLADTYAVGFTAPLIMTVLAVPMLGERIRWRRALSTLVGFGGVLIMLRPGGDLWTPVVVLLLAGTVVMSVTRIMTRQLTTTETPECQAFWLLICHTLTGLQRRGAGLRLLWRKGLVAADYVLIEVADTGTGIPPEVKDKIFEPFFTTKEVGKGTGLGLAMVYGIVKQTGGWVFCDSEPGKGATFRIFLPRHIPVEEDREIKREAVKAPAADLTGHGTILLVEDEEAVRAFGARALASRGYTVLEAGSGSEALDVVAKTRTPIDLVVSDVVMPEMDGPTMFGELRKRGVKAKVIFVSGYAEDAFARNLPQGEDFSFLPKPFSLKQLIEAVKENMG